MSHRVYTAALATLLTLYAPVAVGRRLHRGVPLHLGARLGGGPQLAGPRPRGWLHAVSVGEVIAAAPLVDGLRRVYPELPLVVTTVTDTGARVARERYAGLAEHRFFPLDLPGAARRAIRLIDPAFLICMETELWPNTLRLLAARDTPVMIANGRLSDRSFRRYRLVRGFMRRVLHDVRVCAMQSEADARRIIALGAPPERVFVTGNIKHEPPPDPAGVADLWQRLLGLVPGRPVWVAGSTHHGEDEIVLDAHRAARARHPGLALVLAPRHPERVAEVLGLAAARGWAAVRRSELPRQDGNEAVIVLDTVGELAQLYAVADVVFVGGSLVPAGGHNMLEPALRAKPVLVGPHTDNFREITALLLAAGGARLVGDAPALAGAVADLLDDPARRLAMGGAAREAAMTRHGAVRATLELAERLIRPRAASAPA